MSRLTVMLLTYNRADYAKLTLESLFSNLVHDGEVRLHIADDGSPDGYLDDLENYCRHHIGFTGIISYSNAERGGYGRNFNLATQAIHKSTDIVLPLEDDWQLIRPLDTAIFAPILTGSQCIRLGYLGYTQECKAWLVNLNGHRYLEFDPRSDEPHVFAGHPRLETVTWEQEVGPWPEGLLPGETEMAVAHIWNARCNVLWPLDLVHPNGDLFVHVGTVRSY
jgi:glycosyltransferase involved in cell wall biosynthesis